MCKHDITDDSEGYTDQSVGYLEVPLPALTPPPARSPAPRAPGVRRKYTEHSLPGADLNY